MNKMLEDLVEVVREVAIKPGCWTDTEIMLRRFIRTHQAAITDMATRLKAAERDAARLDWLVAHAVEVRDPMLHGSVHLFTAQTTSDEEDEFHRTSLREQIDAAMQESTERSTPEKAE